MRTSNERGIALITTMLVLMLISALLVGFTAMVMSDQRYRFIDRDRGRAFYAASGGVEKLTADLGNNFFKNVAPTSAQMIDMVATTSLPVVPGVTFTAPAAPETLPGSSLNADSCGPPAGWPHVVTIGAVQGYNVTFCSDAAGNPTSIQPPSNIKTGPYEGLVALQTPYQIDVTAKTASGGEVHLVRTIETVAIPVFQFGIFSEVDLSFSAAETFGFGGRVHTNANLFLAEGSNQTLTLSGRVTAVKEVVRKYLSNTVPIGSVGQTGTVSIASSSSTFVNLAADKGSVVDGPTSALNPTWHNTSLTTYNSWLRNGFTGAKPLNLPLVMPGVGGKNEDIVRRPTITPLESTTSILYNERLFTKASLRILLSDTAADISNIPGVSATAPVLLDKDWNVAANLPGGYGPIAGIAAPVLPALNHPPLAVSPGPLRAVTTNSAGGTINFASAAAAAPFKPTFTFAGFPNNVITCTAKDTANPYRLTGCAGVPSMPVTGAGTLLIATSPAGSASGASAATNTATTAASTEIRFANAATVDTFDPMPFWNVGTAAAPASTYVMCTGYSATAYTGCSSNPGAAAVLTSAVYSDKGISPIGGYIKIERQNASNSLWVDVTTEILNYGIGDQNDGGLICPDPTQFAIIRLQRFRDNAGVGGCNYNTNTTGFKDPANWWPMALFDTREGVLRDSNYPGAANLPLTGVIYYVALDAGNLAKWFKGTAAPYAAATGGTGSLSKKDNGGFTVYFSDRRNNHDNLGRETAEYGFEDFVNPGAAAPYAPSGGLPDAGEDLNGNETLEVYGSIPNYTAPGLAPAINAVPTCGACAATYAVWPTYRLDNSARPGTTIMKSVAQVNRPILFRRALKLMNGAVLAPVITGLTIVSENPVYIKGNWNVNSPFPAPPNSFTTGVHASTSVIADAVTLLSDSWSDGNSMDSPYIAGGRQRGPTNDSYYRVAIMSGKSRIFPKPTDVVAGSTFGTDGGAHSFLRMLEGEGAAADTVHYLGSMATFFYSRQSTGTFKCCGSSVAGISVASGIVYGIPVRDFVFDADFLQPALLPPNTPVFRDMNAVGFSQELRPGR